MQVGAARLTGAMKSLQAAFLVGVEGTTEIWLVRHGDCYEGMIDDPDPALSPLGLRQAQLLAARVKRLGPAAVYSSPSRRALETAREIEPNPRIDERLMEMSFTLSDEDQIVFTETPAGVVPRMSAMIVQVASAPPGARVIVAWPAGVVVHSPADGPEPEPLGP